MTLVFDPLSDVFILLRTANLSAGFDERLEQRLAAVDGVGRVSSSRPWQYRRGALLLAAMALPVAAVASGVLLFEKDDASPAKEALAAIEAKSFARMAPKTFPVPAQRIPAPPKLEDISGRDSPTRELRHPASSHIDTEQQSVSNAAAAVSVPENARAKIESLEVSIPRNGNSGDSARSLHGFGSGSELRTTTGRSHTKSPTSREQSGSQRDLAGERRGSDTAAERERVQARDEKIGR